MVDLHDAYREEAELIGRYLMKITPNAVTQALYAQAVSQLNIDLNSGEEKLWRIAKRYPRTLRVIDGGLAIVNPQSSIRRKMYAMLAILEASPEHCDYFLPKRYPPAYAVRIAWSAIRSVFIAMIGYVFVKLVGVTRS
jgi:hypothetical protein